MSSPAHPMATASGLQDAPLRHIEQRDSGSYRLRINRRHLGTYKTLEEAQRARDAYLAQQVSQEVAPDISVQGVTLNEPLDEQAILAKALSAYQSTNQLDARRHDQIIEIAFSPACVVYVADQHFGNAGTDVARAFAEADIISSMPQTVVATVGDMFDNFILEKMRAIRFDTPMSIQEEIILGKQYMQRLAPKWRLAVDGNHDLWTMLMTGMNWQRELIKDITPTILHDAYDCRVTLRVKGVDFAGRLRHNWRGRSEINDTHGIEKAARFDQDFVWGVGAHTHRSGVVRTFNVAGCNGIAGLCGSYKRVDSYARQNGYPKPNTSTAIAIIFDAETNSMTGFDNLEMAAKVMERLTQK